MVVVWLCMVSACLWHVWAATVDDRVTGGTHNSEMADYSAPAVVCPAGVMVKMLARDSKGREFDSRPFHFQVTIWGKLFTHMRLPHQAL